MEIKRPPQRLLERNPWGGHFDLKRPSPRVLLDGFAQSLILSRPVDQDPGGVSLKICRSPPKYPIRQICAEFNSKQICERNLGGGHFEK